MPFACFRTVFIASFWDCFSDRFIFSHMSTLRFGFLIILLSRINIFNVMFFLFFITSQMWWNSWAIHWWRKIRTGWRFTTFLDVMKRCRLMFFFLLCWRLLGGKFVGFFMTLAFQLAWYISTDYIFSFLITSFTLNYLRIKIIWSHGWCWGVFNSTNFASIWVRVIDHSSFYIIARIFYVKF